MSVNSIYAWGSSAAVILAIVTGLFLSGSPANQRQVRFDEQRVNDLRRLPYSIETYRNDHQKLPDSLEVLANGRRGLDTVPRDPETGAVYMYVIVSENSYRLCADFDLPTQDQSQATFWDHPDGYFCYEIILPENPVKQS